jgi:hypothetical protein
MARTPISWTEPSKSGTVLPAPTAADVSNGNVVFGPWEVANYSTSLQLSGDNATDVSILVLHIPG